MFLEWVASLGGSAAEWVGAVGTTSAFFVGAVALFLERRNRKADIAREAAARQEDLERERLIREADQRDRDAAQARLVIVNVAPGSLRSHSRRVSVVNHSAAPIFAVQVTGMRCSPGAPRFEWAVEGSGVQHTGFRAVMDPGERCTHDVVRFGADGEPYTSAVDSLAADIEFVDALGLRWARTGAHPPVRLTEEPIEMPDHAAPKSPIHASSSPYAK